MSTDSTVEYNSLSWVKKQLDGVLTEAQSNLNEYIEHQDADALQQSIDHLKLVYGTLQMVEVYGAAMLAEEMQHTAIALQKGDVERVEDVFDVLMRAMLQLPDYLENIQAGSKDTPIHLMPLINDLRASRNESLLSESVLFLPDTDNVELEGQGYDATEIEDGKLESEIKRLRPHFQLGLLDIIRNKKERVGLQRIQAVLHAIEKATLDDALRRLWIVSGAFISGLLDGGIDNNASIKALLGTLDRSLKKILDAGVDAYLNEGSDELLKNLLFYIGTCSTNANKVRYIKDAYKLDELLPAADEQDAALIGGLNADLFNTVSTGIIEDMLTVKDVLEIHMDNADSDVQSLVGVGEKLGKIADTFGMLSMGATRQHMAEQQEILNRVIENNEALDEAIVMGIASELINAESDLKAFVERRSGYVDTRSDENKIVPTAEYHEVIMTVVAEALKNFSDAKEALLSHVSGISGNGQLDIILEKIEEVRGVALMLPLDRIESQIEHLKTYVSKALRDNNRKVEIEEQDAIADVVTSIEYFLEALAEGLPGIEHGLDTGDVAAEKLAAIYSQYADAAEDGDVDETLAEGKDVVADKIAAQELDASDAENAIFEKGEMPVESNRDEIAPVASIIEANEEHLAAEVKQGYTILSEDADEEIVEIFIEEAIEVLGDLHTCFPQWKGDQNNEEALANMRRGFHTLKGSGRLIGADLIGEFSWKFENILNRVIDNKVSVSPSLFNALDEALAVLPQLIEQLQGNREPISHIDSLMETADAIAEGKAVNLIDELVESDNAVNLADSTDELAIDLVDLNATPLSDDASEDDDLNNEIELINLDNEMEDIGEPVEESREDILDEQAAEELEVVELTTEDITENESEQEGSELEVVALDGLQEEAVQAAAIPDEIAQDVEDSSTSIKLMDDSEAIVSVVEGEDAGASSDEGLELDAVDTTDIELTFDDDEVEASAEDPISGDLLNINQSADESVKQAMDEESDLDVIDLSPSDRQDSEFQSVDESGLDETVIDEVDVDNETPSSDAELSAEDEISFDESEVIVIDEIDVSDNDEYEIEIDEGDQDAVNELNIDPVLLKIYHGESATHLANVREAIDQHIAGTKNLTAEKDISRAFHTLFGSARTADVAAIAEISGVAEKYLNAKSESADIELDDDAVEVFIDIEQSLGKMLSDVEAERNPVTDKPLLERVSKILQDEIQRQLQGAIVSDETNEIDDAGTLDLEQKQTEPVAAVEESSAENIVVDDYKSDYADIDEDLIDIFLEEAGELLESCEKTVLAMRNQPNAQEHTQNLQRNMHTLKGGARMADLAPVGDLTHILESLVVKVSEQKVAMDNRLFDVLDESIDALIDMMSKVKRRVAIHNVDGLADKITRLIEGETQELRQAQRYEVDLSELEDIADNDASDNESNLSLLDESEPVAEVVVEDQEPERRETDKPHWGERASDVNYVESHEQVRVRSDLLNNLVNYAGEVNIYHARLGKQVSDFGFNLSELSQTVIRLKEQLRKLEIETEIQIRSGYDTESDAYSTDFDPLEMDRYSTVQQLSRSLMETAGDVESINAILSEITRDSETLLLQESRVSSDLQEGLMRTRMVRFGGLSSRLRRIVRQVSRELDKDVVLNIVGEESEVDRTVLDRIVAPLEHMLRNAIAHGIENAEQRVANGKPESGTITLSVGRQGTNVVINVRDDGQGMDVAKIREKAISHGLLDEAAELPDHEMLQFILNAGFSTADEITQVAGRGVGMDVVDNEIKQLGGVLEINSVAGEGSEFNIRLPLTLAINQALLVSTGEDVYAVPLASIEGVVRVTGVELQRFYDSDDSYYEFNGVEYELKHLGNMLNGNRANYSKQLRLYPVLLVVVGDQHFALHVEDLLGRREIVVKPVGMQIGTVRGIAGATILADGRVVLILEVAALMVAPKQVLSDQADIEVENTELKAKTHARISIMVVDDSITIRKVTERILGRNGFDVILAKDGVDATNKMQDHIPDLMLLDIEMPRMDGFEVAAYVRNDERLKDLPIIMITSRTGSKHKEKAMEIGVNQYLGKPYQEEELMSNINNLLDDVS